MDGGSSEGSEARFAAYVEALGVVLGHVDRQQPMHDYCLGLLMRSSARASNRWRR
jgi:SRSO17 transposase